jgi:hypothetical protein
MKIRPATAAAAPDARKRVVGVMVMSCSLVRMGEHLSRCDGGYIELVGVD